MRRVVNAGLYLVLILGSGMIGFDGRAQPPSDNAPLATAPGSASASSAPVSSAPISSAANSTSARFPPIRRAVARPAAAAAAGPPTISPIPPAALEAFVDGVVRASMASRHIAGVAVAVVQNGQVLLKKGYGVARLDPASPVDPDRTLFRLGGVADTFTWITLMKEAEAGHMRLTAPVNLYLPEKLQIRDQGFKRPVLVRDLMAQTAGFEDRALGQLAEQDPNRIRPLAVYLREERPRRVREPGSAPVFSNYGVALAGEAVSYVNGHRFQDLVETEITRPLGLNRTTFREPYPARADLPAPMPDAQAADLSTGFRWAGGVFHAQPFAYASQIAPAAALSSTAGDMARYMQMILNGGQLNGESLYDADTAKGFRTTLQSAAPGVNGWDDGFMEYSLPGGFRGQGENGDTLWFHSSLVTVPDLGLGVFVTTNTDTGQTLAQTLPGQIVTEFYTSGQTPPRPGSPALAADAGVYAGAYLDERRPHGGLEKFARMFVSETKVSVTRDGHLLTTGEIAGAWTPDGPPGHFRQVDGHASLVFDIENGRAQQLYPPSGASAFDRVGLVGRFATLAVLAALTATAAIATLVGLITRDRREARQTPTQARAGLVQTTIAVLWLIALTDFGLWAAGAGDPARTMYHWPGALLLMASACAFVAALLTLLTIVMAPTVWRGGRRLDSWTGWRKLRFTLSTLIYAGFSVVLMGWGALEPWSR